MSCEFGILLIKPDGVEAELMPLCEVEIKKAGLSIVKSKMTMLDRDDIVNYFYYKFEHYIEYMTQNKVCAYLVKGKNVDIDKELYVIKDKIRREKGVSGKILKNYLHSTHSGSEYFIQRKLFFPECELPEYSSYSDLYIVPKYKDISFQRKMDYLFEKSGIKKIAVCFQEKNFEEKARWLSEILKNREYHIASYQDLKVKKFCCRIMKFYAKNSEHFFKEKRFMFVLSEISDIEWGADIIKGIDTIEDFISAKEHVFTELLRLIVDELHNLGINIEGLMVNTAKMSITEAEMRFEAAKALELIPIGGSGRYSDIGLFGMSVLKYEAFRNKLCLY